MSKNILKLIQDMNEQIAVLKAEVKAKGVDGLSELGKDVFSQVEGLKKFVIVGYTPGFNDGEPCYHSSFYGFGNYHYRESYRRDGSYYLSSDDVGEREHFNEFFELDEEAEYEKKEQMSISYANSGVKDADLAYELIGALDDVCEMLFDTNYEVRFTLNEDGSVSVDQDDFDCGY